MDRVGSFEIGYAFDALVIQQTHAAPCAALEQFIYTGDDRQITHRFCQGRVVPTDPHIDNL